MASILHINPAAARGRNLKDLRARSILISGRVPGQFDGSGIVVPFEAMSRAALATNVFSAAGALVASDQAGIEPMLRPASICLAAGARMLTGLQGNTPIPRELTSPGRTG